MQGFIFGLSNGLLLLYVHWCHVCLRAGVKSPGTRVTDSCELPCGYWEPNLRPLEEQPVLLTTESALQLCKATFLKPLDK